MNRDIDPFQPWRPKEESLPRTAEPEPLYLSPAEPELQPMLDPIRRPLAGRIIAVVVVGISCFIHVVAEGLPSLPRLMPAYIVLGTSLVFAVVWRRDRLRVVGVLALGVAVFLFCWCFLPTTGGMNWVKAREEVEAMKDAPIGEFMHFMQGKERRDLILHEFPWFKSDVKAFERDWLQRSMKQFLAELNRDRTLGAREKIDAINAMQMKLTALDRYNLSRSDLRQARRDEMKKLMDETTTAVDAEFKAGNHMEALEKARRFHKFAREQEEGGETLDVSAWLLQIRKRWMSACLDEARRSVRKLAGMDDFIGAVAVADGFVRMQSAEADELGLGGELAAFLQAARDLAGMGER